MVSTLGLLVVASCAERSSDKPHIVFILADDLVRHIRLGSTLMTLSSDLSWGKFVVSREIGMRGVNGGTASFDIQIIGFGNNDIWLTECTIVPDIMGFIVY